MEHLAASGASSITDLAAPFDVSIMAISKHVRVLREAMVITVERDGRTHWCTVNFEVLRFAREWLDHHERVSREVELFELAATAAGKTRDWAEP